jgi:hypothetical protein
LNPAAADIFDSLLMHTTSDTLLRLPQRRWLSGRPAIDLSMPTVDGGAVGVTNKALRHSGITKEARALAIGMVTPASGTSRARHAGTPRLVACPRCQAGKLIGWQV